jgi:hypothetical protein
MKTEAARFSETLVRIYQTIRWHTPEERNRDNHKPENSKTHTKWETAVRLRMFVAQHFPGKPYQHLPLSDQKPQ